MLHKMPAVADTAGPHTADHSLNNETDDRLLERGKTLSLLLLDPTPIATAQLVFVIPSVKRQKLLKLSSIPHFHAL